GLSLFVAPAAVVPAALVLEVVASLAVWRTAVRDLNGDWLKSLIIGNAICIPFGVYLLAHLDPIVLRLVVGIALLVTAAGLRWRGAHPLETTREVQGITGALSGFLNGLAASGGVGGRFVFHDRSGDLDSSTGVGVAIGDR
ncbi:MAG: TSUP family transporter, partial [Polaromonas sp.]